MAEISLRQPDSYLPTPGTPKVPWPRWARSFILYLEASGLSTAAADRQKAILLHCLGAEGQRLYFANVTESDHKKLKFKEMLQEMTTLFHRTNTAAERSKFRSRKQQPGETITEYIATLRELAASCNFKSFEDEMIRDQLTEFSSYPKVRELLTAKEFTLDEAIKKAKEVEDGQLAAQMLESKEVMYVSGRSRQHVRPTTERRSSATSHCNLALRYS